MDQARRLDLFEAVSPRARLHAAEIQQRLHQPLQALRLAHQRRVVDLPPLLVRHPPQFQNLRKLPDGGQRRAELVRHRRDEVRLHPRYLHFASDGARDEIRSRDQEQHHHPHAEQQESLAFGQSRSRRIGRAADVQRPRQLALRRRPDGGPVGAVAPPEHHAAFDIHRGAGHFFSGGNLRSLHQHAAPRRRWSATSRRTDVPLPTPLSARVRRARSKPAPPPRPAPAGLQAHPAEVELELPARQVPAAAQQIRAQRAIPERVARHQVGRRSCYAHALDRRQARVCRAALLTTSELAQHARQAQQRSRSNRRILTLCQHTIGIGSLGRLRLQELEQFAFRENLGRRFPLVGSRGVIEQPSRRVRCHGVLFHGEQHPVVRFARGRRVP